MTSSSPGNSIRFRIDLGFSPPPLSFLPLPPPVELLRAEDEPELLLLPSKVIFVREDDVIGPGPLIRFRTTGSLDRRDDPGEVLLTGERSRRGAEILGPSLDEIEVAATAAALPRGSLMASGFPCARFR